MQKRKLIALFLAMVMALALAIPAMAASHAIMAQNGNGTITITAPEHHNLAAANTFTLYQLYDLQDITGSTAPYQFVYTANQTVKNFLAWVEAGVEGGAHGWNSSMVYAKPTLAGYGVTTLPSVDAVAAAEEFRQWLQTFDNSDADHGVFDAQKIIELATMMVLSGIEPKVINPATDLDEMPSSLKFKNLDFAYYLVVGQGKHETNPDGTPNVTRGMLVNVPEYEDHKQTSGNLTKDAKRDLKIDVPTVDKEVYDHNSDDWQDETDLNVGDTIKYQLTSYVPDTTGYLGYSFIMTDILSKGLSFVGARNDEGYLTVVPGSVKITIGGDDYTGFTARHLAASDLNPANLGKLDGVYDFAGDPYMLDGGHLLIIDFTPSQTAMEAFMAKAAGAEIVVSYQAILNEDAVIGAPGNPNKVILFYNTNPTASPCVLGKTPPEVTIVYTFDLNLLKVDGETMDDAVPTKLAGAEFELKKASGGDSLWFKKNGTTYTHVKAGTAGAVQTLISGADGVIYIKGLDAGSYNLIETKAPIGYNLPVAPDNIFPFTIVHVAEADGTYKGKYTVNGAIGRVGDLLHECMVPNFTGGVLPGTGGSGTYVFFGVGIGLAILLAAAFVIYKRKRTLGMLSA